MARVCSPIDRPQIDLATARRSTVYLQHVNKSSEDSLSDVYTRFPRRVHLILIPGPLLVQKSV